MYSGLLTLSKFNTVIRCVTTEKVAIDLPPRIFGFTPLPSVALRSGCLFVLMNGWSYFGN
jgi:hypothetical protein